MPRLFHVKQMRPKDAQRGLSEQVDAAMAAYAPRFKMDPPVIRGEWAFISGHKA